MALTLSGEDQTRIIEELYNFSRGGLPQKQAIRKSFESAPMIATGPIGGRCPFCGK